MADSSSSSSSSSISGSSLIWVGITLGIVSVFVRPETILCHAKRIVTITVDENENENETATVTSTARTAARTTTTARRSFVYGIVLGLVYGLGVCVFTVFMALLFSPSFHVSQVKSILFNLTFWYDYCIHSFIHLFTFVMIEYFTFLQISHFILYFVKFCIINQLIVLDWIGLD